VLKKVQSAKVILRPPAMIIEKRAESIPTTKNEEEEFVPTVSKPDPNYRLI